MAVRSGHSCSPVKIGKSYKKAKGQNKSALGRIIPIGNDFIPKGRSAPESIVFGLRLQYTRIVKIKQAFNDVIDTEEKRGYEP